VPNFEQKIFDRSIVEDLYEQGNGGIKISKKLGISVRQVYNILDHLGVPRKTNGWHARKHELNERFFDNLTPTSSYWLGMLCADGDTHNSKIRLGLKLSDIGHLRKFALVLKSTYQPRMEHPKSGFASKDRYYPRLYIGSSYMVSKLYDLGFQDFKIGYINLIERLDNKLFWHWLRGFSDGDGTVSWRKPRNKMSYPVWSLVSPHRDILYYLGNRIAESAGVNILNVYKCKTIFNIKAERRKAEAILRLMYAHCFNNKLDRKFESYRTMVVEYTRRAA
jgi:hypothetical protein